MLCPVKGCGDIYLHIMDIALVDGTHQPPDRTTKGSQAVVSFKGECGHKFDLVLAHHKGRTSIGFDSLKDENA